MDLSSVQLFLLALLVLASKVIATRATIDLDKNKDKFWHIFLFMSVKGIIQGCSANKRGVESYPKN